MIAFLFRLLIIYLVFRLVMFVVKRAVVYYNTYRQIQERNRRYNMQNQQKSREDKLDLQKFDVEDADFVEVDSKTKD